MLAFCAGSQLAVDDTLHRVAASLGLFAGTVAPHHHVDNAIYAWLPPVDRLPPRAARQSRGLLPAWRPATSTSGARVLFHGRFDNRSVIAAELGVADAGDAEVYGAAVDRWGDDADARLVGHYCAVVHQPGTLNARLSRSALRAPPLHYFQAQGLIAAASVPRVLEVLGLERRLYQRKLVDALYFNPTGDEDFIEGGYRVGIGRVVHLSPADRRIVKFYDPLAVRPLPKASTAEYIAEVDRLLHEACAVAIAGARQPGITLSGGLDSPNVAARVLAALPEPVRLKSFTYRPLPDHKTPPRPFQVYDERANVERFAAMHPRIEPHFTENAETHFDTMLETQFLAMGTCQSHVAVNFRYLGIFDLARKQGCDVLLTSDMGEQSFSAYGDWGYAEFFRTGRWRQLYRALKADHHGKRPLWRRFVSRAIIPSLPHPLWRLWKRLIGQATKPINTVIATVTPSALEKFDTIARARTSGVSFEKDEFGSRRESLIDQFAREDAESSDYLQGLEQIFEVRLRDATAYRPLIDYCLGLPTTMFMRDGIKRWLARELGRGHLPEDHRTSLDTGIQAADWLDRLTPRRDDLRREVAMARADPDCAFLDFAELERMLDEWPTEPTYQDDTYFRCGYALPRAVVMARYVRYMTGRNPQLPD